MRTSVMRLAVAVVVTAASVPASARELCGFQYETIQELEATVRNDRRYSMTDVDARFVAFLESSGFTILSFAKPAHPAWPSAACRTIERQPAGNWAVTTEISCFNTKEVCDHLHRDYQELDAAMKEYNERNYGTR